MHAPLSSVSRLSFSGDGTVEGYASLFGEIDQARDMMMPGAFTQTLKTRGLRKIPMLFQHDPAEPVGVWLELREDFRGLWARGKLIPDVMRARITFSGRGRRGGRVVDRLSHRTRPDRSAHARASSLSGRLVGDFYCHVPAAGGSACPRREAGDAPVAALARADASRARAAEHEAGRG
jgi:hypothetical protein